MAAPPELPRTVAGLVATLSAGVDESSSMAAAFAEFARRLEPTWTKTGRTRRRPNGTGGPAIAVLERSDVAPGVLDAATLARRLSDALRAAPAVLSALSALSVPAVPVAAPLYVPDDLDPGVIRDAGTGNPATGDGVNAPVLSVTWWPFLTPAAVTAGLSLLDVEITQLFGSGCASNGGTVERVALTPWRELIECAGTLRLVEGRFRGYDDVARTVRGGGPPGRRAARRAIRTAANQYEALAVFLRPIVDQMAARYAYYIRSLSDALTALSATEGLELPTVATASAVINSLATRIRDAITTGHGGRLEVSDSEVAFAWAPGPAVTLLSYLAQGTVEGRRTTVVQAKNSATPVVPTAENAAKPMVVDFTSADVNLKKYPGQATISVESAMFVANIETAVATVITGQVVRAIEADAAAAIDAAAGIDIPAAADITAGVLAAIAAIRSNGGAPNVVGLSAADWIEIMGQTGSAGFVNFADVEAGPAGLWLGCAPVIVPGLAAGSAIVADGRSVTVSEPKGGPLCIVDPFTEAKNNKIVITVEAFAVPAVTSPGGVATVTVTP